MVEQKPQFPGGDAALLKWVSEHIRYPAMAQESNIQGRVVVQFVVTKTGKVGEVKVLRSKDPDLDKEAVRVVKSLPAFVPGKMNGHAVNVWYTLPVTFKLRVSDPDSILIRLTAAAVFTCCGKDGGSTPPQS